MTEFVACRCADPMKWLYFICADMSLPFVSMMKPTSPDGVLSITIDYIPYQ
jgi:hypothetical protein